MFDQLKSKKINVAISKGNSPRECVLKSIETLGGISKFINEGDQVFIKFNVTIPGGFPINTNPEVIGAIISSCKKAGARKILLGSFPLKRIPLKVIFDYLGIQEYFESLGAQLVYLDNSDIFCKDPIKPEELKKIKDTSFLKIPVNDTEYLFPKIILDSDKLIIVNQVNVNPLFNCNLSLMNSYSNIPPIHQEIVKDSHTTQEYVSHDKYRKDLVSQILDVFTIKKPDLVINDTFYILEGAGPYIYKDSNLLKPGFIIAGENGGAVDLITLTTLNINIDKNELIIEARKRNINIPALSSIKVLGEKIGEITTDIQLCVSNLKDIRVMNFELNTGKYCSGCFKQAYHLLNLMKTYMVKDLKYNVYNSFLIGENPTEPENLSNIILFGDCSISSTVNHKFRKIVNIVKQDIKKKKENKKSKEKKIKEPVTKKEKPNKKILELPGCPPRVFDCIKLVLNYYGRKNVPNLNLLSKINNLWISGKSSKNLKMWEAL